MGLFGFIGKALGSVAKVALGALPGGSVVKGIAGGALSLLSHKAPMATSSIKYQIANQRGTGILRGTVAVVNGISTPVLRRQSPVMPGGAVATSQGIMAPGGGVPPTFYGGRKSTGKRRKHRSRSSRSNSRKRSSKRRSGRKLKFGSAAYRKKYLGHR